MKSSKCPWYTKRWIQVGLFALVVAIFVGYKSYKAGYNKSEPKDVTGVFWLPTNAEVSEDQDLWHYELETLMTRTEIRFEDYVARFRDEHQRVVLGKKKVIYLVIYGNTVIWAKDSYQINEKPAFAHSVRASERIDKNTIKQYCDRNRDLLFFSTFGWAALWGVISFCVAGIVYFLVATSLETSRENRDRRAGHAISSY